MTTSRPVRLVAVAAIAGCAALSLSGVSAASTHHSTKKAPKPKTGLYATGDTRISTSTQPSAYAANTANYEHFVQFKAGPSATKGVLVYRSRKLGAKTWVVHNAPGSFNTSGQPRVEILIDAQDTSQQDVIAYTCSGVFAATVANTAARLPEFTKVSPVSDCTKTTRAQKLAAGFYNANLASGYLNVIVPDATTAGRYDVVSGKPGTSFKQIATVPSDHGFVPTQFVGQSFNGGTVIGQGTDADGNKGVYATNLEFAYDSTTEADVATWTDLKEIATIGSATKNYSITSSSTYRGTTDVGLYLAVGSRTGQKHTLFVDEQDTSGQWSGALSIDYTTLHDKALIVSTNATTGKPRATWLRAITSSKKAKTTKSGIMSSRLIGGSWTVPAFQTHWYKDAPLSTTYDSKTVPHFFYKQTA